MSKSENVVNRLCQDLHINSVELAKLLGCSRAQVSSVQQGCPKWLPGSWRGALEGIGLDFAMLAADYENYRVEEQARLVRVVKERLASGSH